MNLVYIILFQTMNIYLLLNDYLFLFGLVCIIEYKFYILEFIPNSLKKYELWQFCKIKKIITTTEKRGKYFKAISIRPKIIGKFILNPSENRRKF